MFRPQTLRQKCQYQGKTSRQYQRSSGYCYVIIDHEYNLFKPSTLYRVDNVIDNVLRELNMLCVTPYVGR